jgi:hypothetical protein
MSDLSKRFSLDYLISGKRTNDYDKGFQDCKKKVFEILIKHAKNPKTDYVQHIFEDIGKL